MTDKTFTQAELDAAIAAAKEAQDEKNRELLGELRDLKSKLRATSEIKPEDLSAMEARAEKAEADLAAANKQIKTLTTERDTAVKSLEAETGVARGYALEAELSAAIAEGNVLPALVPALKAMLTGQAKVELADGKYAVQIGDKPARDHIKAFLDTDEGKAFRAAPLNGGGGAPGGGGAQGGKTVAQSEFNTMSAKDRAAFMADGGQIADAA